MCDLTLRNRFAIAFKSKFPYEKNTDLLSNVSICFFLLTKKKKTHKIFERKAKEHIKNKCYWLKSNDKRKQTGCVCVCVCNRHTVDRRTVCINFVFDMYITHDNAKPERATCFTKNIFVWNSISSNLNLDLRSGHTTEFKRNNDSFFFSEELHKPSPSPQSGQANIAVHANGLENVKMNAEHNNFRKKIRFFLYLEWTTTK